MLPSPIIVHRATVLPTTVLTRVKSQVIDTVLILALHGHERVGPGPGGEARVAVHVLRSTRLVVFEPTVAASRTLPLPYAAA